MSKRNNKKVSIKTYVLSLVVNALTELLPLGLKRGFKDKDIYNIVVNASSRRTSINQVCKDLKKSPKPRTVRHHLTKLQMSVLESNINKILQKYVVDIIPKKALKFAIDLTYIPYYGKEFKKEDEIIHSQAKNGTTNFHAYATIYLILFNKRFTLAMMYVRKGTTLNKVIDILINEVTSLGLDIRCLFLDRGFYSIRVINHLQRKQIPFVMPVVKKGKSGGIRKILVGKRSYKTNYTMTCIKTKTSATFPVCVIRKYSKGKYCKHGVKYFGYVVYGIHIPMDRVFEEYRKRFGVESSYRIMNMARARTSSRNPKLRLLYVVVSLLLMNLWVYSKWKFLSEKRRGGRKVDNDKMTYQTMLNFINDVIKDIYGIIEIFIEVEIPKGKWKSLRMGGVNE